MAQLQLEHQAIIPDGRQVLFRKVWHGTCAPGMWQHPAADGGAAPQPCHLHVCIAGAAHAATNTWLRSPRGKHAPCQRPCQSPVLPGQPRVTISTQAKCTSCPQNITGFSMQLLLRLANIYVNVIPLLQDTDFYFRCKLTRNI